jgi:D-arabinose 1-dehydrogenase-like Zn-dependent alcohol dehydrogenase
VPVPGTGDVLLRTTVAGVSGSDMHAALGSHPFIDLPYRPGHELVATVAETGHGFQSGGGWWSSRTCSAATARSVGPGGTTSAAS